MKEESERWENVPTDEERQKRAILLQLYRSAGEPGETGELRRMLENYFDVQEGMESFARELAWLFLGGPAPHAEYSIPLPGLVLAGELLLCERELFTPERADALAEAMDARAAVRWGTQTCDRELLTLYEILFYYRHTDPEKAMSLFEERIVPAADDLARAAPLDLSDLFLLVGRERLNGGDAAEGEELVGLCMELRRESFSPESPQMLLPRSFLMEARYLAGDGEGAAQLAEEILACPGDTDSVEILCSARLLLADIRLDLLDTSGVPELLSQAESETDALSPDSDSRPELLFRLHTGYTRFYMLEGGREDSLLRLEYHARQAYRLCRESGAAAESRLIAINNLLYPLAFSSRTEEAGALMEEAAELIRSENLYETRVADYIYNAAVLLELEDKLEPRQREAGLRRCGAASGDGAQAMNLMSMLNGVYTRLDTKCVDQELLAAARAVIDRCDLLAGRFNWGVNGLTIALKRTKAMYFLHQGARVTARRWMLSALEDARAHPGLDSRGALFDLTLNTLPLIMAVLDGIQLRALLSELAAGTEERVRKLLLQRDEDAILRGLWANNVIVNLMVYLSDSGAIQCSDAEIFELIVNGKSIYSRLLRLNKKRREANPANAEIYARLDALSNGIARAELGRLLRGENSGTKVLREEKRRLELTLTEAAGEDFRWISCRETAERLPERAAYLDYYLYPAAVGGEMLPESMRYAVFVLYRERGQVRLSRLPALDFQEVRRDLLLVTSGARAKKNRALADVFGAAGYLTLYGLLFYPLEAMLPPDTETLFLSPDGDLTRLPFGLLSGDSQTFLRDRFSVVYLESARDLKPDVAVRLRPGSAVVAGNPDFSLTPMAEENAPAAIREHLVEKLPFTRTEAGLVAEKLGVKPLLRRAAGKDLLRGCHAGVIHIATHGAYFADESDSAYEYSAGPLRRSVLYFSGANDWLLTGREDARLGNGILTAGELCRCDMAPPELVVLSACFSAMGDLRQGNGLVGLQTAFRVQGARAMLLSLWEADDFASAVLMDRFYDCLTTMPAGRALREAQRCLRDATVADLRAAGWFDAERCRRIGLVAADVLRMSALDAGARPFAHMGYWGGYILCE